MLELDRLQRRLDRVNSSLALFDRPARFLFLNGGIYVLLPTLMLVAAHYLVIMNVDAPRLFLRIASVIIPLPFGMAAFALSKIGYRGAFGLGALTAALSVFGMLSVVSYFDGAPMVPATPREWRETIEYGLSIALSFRDRQSPRDLRPVHPSHHHRIRAVSRMPRPIELRECWDSMWGRKPCVAGRDESRT